jgi:hypothetical protein
MTTFRKFTLTALGVRIILFNPTLMNNFSVCIVAVSVIGRGNRSEQRKPQTCRKLLTSLTCHLDNVFNYLNMN